MKRLLLFAVSLLFLIAGLFAGRASLLPQGDTKLQYFYYGGYNDTIYSLVSGKVFTKQGNELVPLAGVAVNDHVYNTDHSGTATHVVHTDTAGHVLIAFTEGTFDIVLRKEGYTTLTLKHFRSHPDQVSSFSVVLSKGTGEKEIEIPEDPNRE